MSRVAIPVTKIVRTGTTPPSATVADHSNGMQFVNNGATWLEVISSDGGSQTVGFILGTGASALVDGLTLPEKTITIPAGATRLIGPFPPQLYNQSGSLVFVDPSVPTTLTLRAYTL